MAPWLRYLAAFIVFAHGFVYIPFGLHVPGDIKEWNEKSWFLGNAVTGEKLKRLIAYLHVTTGILVIITAIAIAFDPVFPGWWHFPAIISSLLGILSFAVFWDGQSRYIFEEGVVGLLISMFILVMALAV